MRLTVRRVGWGVIAVVVVLASMATIEICTSIYRIDEFIRRTGRIHEGMTESEVRTAAGVPDTFIADLEVENGLVINTESRWGRTTRMFPCA